MRRNGIFRLPCACMKPGKYDRKQLFLIAGVERRELKRHTEDLPQSFALDNRLLR